MKIPSSFIASGAIAIGAAAYFFLRGGLGGAVAPETAAPAAPAADEIAPVVVVAEPRIEERTRVIELNGRTEAARVVTVRAEVVGVVVDTPVREGERVTAGQVLCRLDVEARAARVAEGEATVAQRALELAAANELADRGHRAANQVAAAQAAADAAEAALAQARIDLANVEITAPFDGVFDERNAEIGDYLGNGDPCGVVA
ncbi:MAG: biotin/lipoyl-binding protein, partial [Caulobacterales bacterium]|nr:biotin/lipoyl-binding protein [Caulobacterales bacterium]